MANCRLSIWLLWALLVVNCATEEDVEDDICDYLYENPTNNALMSDAKPPQEASKVEKSPATNNVSTGSSPGKGVDSNHNLNCTCGKANLEQRIVNGNITLPNELPWMAALKVGGHFQCGGSLINDRYMLTAAHCVFRLRDRTTAEIILGAHNEYEFGPEVVRRPISDIIIHETYINGTSHDSHDIALIKLASEVSFNENILPVCLPRKGEAVPYGQIAGWGKMAEYGVFSSLLRAAEVDILTRDECLKESRYSPSEIDEDNFCANREGIDACTGDSGGPVVAEVDKGRKEQIGIVSWGKSCAHPDYPGVYTNVSYYLQWILEKTQDGFYCNA